MPTRIIVIVYLLITAIFVSDIVLAFYKMSYAGYYTDKVICWVWLIATIGIFIRLWKKRGIRIYAGLLAVVGFLSFMPMMDPLYGAVHYFTTASDHQHIALNDKYRLEHTHRGVMGRDKMLIIEKRGLLEKEICLTYQSAIVKQLPYQQFYVINQARLLSAGSDNICVDYVIDGTELIFCHPVEKE